MLSYNFAQVMRIQLSCHVQICDLIGSIKWKREQTEFLVFNYELIHRIIMCMRPANERRRYTVTPPLIGWVHRMNPDTPFNSSRDGFLVTLVDMIPYRCPLCESPHHTERSRFQGNRPSGFVCLPPATVTAARYKPQPGHCGPGATQSAPEPWLGPQPGISDWR